MQKENLENYWKMNLENKLQNFSYIENLQKNSLNILQYLSFNKALTFREEILKQFPWNTKYLEEETYQIVLSSYDSKNEKIN
jgi:hypothetical protein